MEPPHVQVGEWNKKRLEGIVASAMDAIISVDSEHRIVLFNPAAEKMFGWTAEAALGQPFLKLIPEYGTLFNTAGLYNHLYGERADGEMFAIDVSISTLSEPEWLGTAIIRDVSERNRSEQARLLLAREVDHRAKNVMAVTQALITMSEGETKEEFVAAVQGRIESLARAQTLLAENAWQGASLGQVVRSELNPYTNGDQVRITGRCIALQPGTVQPLSMIFHELTTNANKYGALSTGGHIDVSWFIHSLDLRIRWMECDGPITMEPSREGFGATLLRQLVTRQLGGTLEKWWNPEGLVADITLPQKAYFSA